MPQFSLNKYFPALFSVAFTLSAVAAPPVETSSRVNFTTLQDFMVIVPVSINGAGPFHFLLDTGTTRTMVDRKIADQLSLPRVAQSMAVGIQGDASVSHVHADSVSMGGSTVPGLSLTVLPKNAGLPEKVRGILGEDFLERFDLLLDYRHHVIELQSGDGPLAEALGGERIPIRLEGMMEGGPVVRRLIVFAHALELGRRDVSLQLDSGVNSLVMFGGRQSLGAGAIQQNFDIAGSVQSSNGVSVYSTTITQLWLGYGRTHADVGLRLDLYQSLAEIRYPRPDEEGNGAARENSGQ
jgi:predicted aspartyl protease